jgi:hypothetical protein
MTKHLSIVLAILFTGLANTAIRGQGLPSGEVDVIKNFNARLIETEKYRLRPELPPLDTIAKIQEYNISALPLNVDYPPPKIRPIAMRPQDPGPVYPGYARLGTGLPKAFFAEGGYSLANSENFVLDARIFHYSADNSAHIENQKFSDTEAGLKGTFHLEDQGMGIQGKANYSLNNVFFYGYNDLGLDSTVTFASDDVKQSFSMLELGGEVFNSKPTQLDFNYSGSVDFYHLEDNYAARENGVDIKLKGTKWFEDQHALQVIMRAEFTGYRDTADQSLNNYYLNPSFTYHGDVFRAKVGINAASSEDEFFFFPDVEVAVTLLGNLLTAYAGAEGNLYKNNFRNLSEYNPFISSRPELRNTNYNHFYGGVQGEILGADYQAQAGFKRCNDLALYLSDEDTIPRFNVLYDTVDIFTIKGSLTMPVFENFNLIGSIAQNLYSPKNQDKAWHLPSLELNVGASYVMLDNRLSLRGDLFVENGVPILDADGTNRHLNALFDLSASAEFMFTQNIGAFARVNNLLDNERERWHHYPVLGINGVVGLSARF